MKFFTLSLVTVFFSLALTAQHQTQHFPDLHPDSVMRQNPRYMHMMFEPGELLICFEDNVDVNIFKSNGIAQTGMEGIDEIFSEFQIKDARQLLKGAKKDESKQTITTFNGETFDVPNLHNIYLLKFEGDFAMVLKLAHQLNNEKQIVFAEPNYIYTLADNKPSTVFQDTYPEHFNNTHNENTSFYKSGVIQPNDPLLAQQSYIAAIRADSAWFHSQGSEEHIIAVLDTGVDWQHPDLENKIWLNEGEIQNYADTDGNGFIDDVRGWDFINNDNNPMDDNGHGTHVAGIAAAEANNDIGIAGVSWNARIMPIKVFTSHGTGNAATITQGIIYAVENGATILNMSFSSFARSQALENALINAYQSADLVASAGNHGLSIYFNDGIYSYIAYPAAFPFVFGVQSPSGFSNFDPDGPIASDFPGEELNYELSAPGESIVSTFLNGTYKALSGTSMAAPMVSGAISLYRNANPDRTKEDLWSDLIHYSNGLININQSIISEVKHPHFDMMQVSLSDTLQVPENDGDGFYDAGETILVWAKIRNTFGHADSAYIKLMPSDYGNPDDIIMLQDSVFIGSISTYATRYNDLPLVFQINPQTPNGRTITLQLLMKNAGNEEEFVQDFDFMVYSGTNLSGLITEDIILTPDKLWLFNANTRLDNGVTMTIMPGTHVELNAGFDNRGTVICVGTPDSLIYLKGGFSGNIVYDFVDINLRGTSISGSTITNSKIYNGTGISFNKLINSEVDNFHGSGIMIDSLISSKATNLTDIGSFQINSLTNSIFSHNILHIPQLNSARHTFFDKLLNTNVYYNPNSPSLWQNRHALNVNAGSTDSFFGNTFISTGHMFYFAKTQGGQSSVSFPNQYWGTVSDDKISTMYLDFWYDASLPFLIYEPKLEAPHPETPAHVWKVLVNGTDAQDDIVDPIGPGQQRFDVYFNRPMDTIYSPGVTFGVRHPYTQHAVADSAWWSSDSLVYTAWKTFHLYTGDGINRIRVADARCPNGWDIPVEDKRFEFLIDAAGSASIDFTATPGIGKVDLEWYEPDDLPTLLGYNMYRFHHLTDTTFSDTLLVNSALITDTVFTDFNVNPLQKYYYMYRIVRTDFTESDYSKVVNTTVLTASPGDANGDQLVNILDITTIIAYILNQNPQPFLSDAADVNGDGQINLLDIIGVVNIIMDEGKSTLISQPGHIYLRPEQIELQSDGSLAGLQFTLVGKNISELELKSQLKGFEFVRYISGDTLTGMLFNMHNTPIPEGRITLFDIVKHPGTLEWGEVYGGNTAGRYVAIFKDEDALPVDHRYSFKVFPNPAKEHLVTDIQLPAKSEISLQLYDMFGRSIKLMDKAVIDSGRHQFRFSKQQLPAAKGIYILQVQIRPLDENELPFRKELKLLLM